MPQHDGALAPSPSPAPGRAVMDTGVALPGLDVVIAQLRSDMELERAKREAFERDMVERMDRIAALIAARR